MRSRAKQPLESIQLGGRAWGLLGGPRGLDLLTKAWQTYEHMKATDAQAHARTATSLAKSILEAAIKTKITDVRYMEQIGRQGMQIAATNQLPRLVQDMEQLMKTALE